MKSRLLTVLIIVAILTVSTLASTPININASESAQEKVSKLFPYSNFFNRNRIAVKFTEGQLIDATQFKGTSLPLEFFLKLNGIEFERIGDRYYVIKPNRSNNIADNNAKNTSTPGAGAELKYGRLANFNFKEDSIATVEQRANFIAKYGIGGKAVAEMIPSPWNTHPEVLSLGVTATMLPNGTIVDHYPVYDKITWSHEMFQMYYKNPPTLIDEDGQSPPYHLKKNEFFAWLERADSMLSRTFSVSTGTPGTSQYSPGREIVILDNGATFKIVDWDYNPRVRYEIDASITIGTTVSPSFAVLLRTFSKYYFVNESEAKTFYDLVMSYPLKTQGITWSNINIEFMKPYKIGEREVIFKNNLQSGAIQVDISDKGYSYSQLRTNPDYSSTPNGNYPNLNGEGR